jgi:hypothetical protein
VRSMRMASPCSVPRPAHGLVPPLPGAGGRYRRPPHRPQPGDPGHSWRPATQLVGTRRSDWRSAAATRVNVSADPGGGSVHRRVPPRREIILLVPYNRMVRPIRKALATRGMPVLSCDDDAELDTPMARRRFALLKLLLDRGDQVAELAHFPRPPPISASVPVARRQERAVSGARAARIGHAEAAARWGAGARVRTDEG